MAGKHEERLKLVHLSFAKPFVRPVLVWRFSSSQPLTKPADGTLPRLQSELSAALAKIDHETCHSTRKDITKKEDAD